MSLRAKTSPVGLWILAVIVWAAGFVFPLLFYLSGVMMLTLSSYDIMMVLRSGAPKRQAIFPLIVVAVVVLFMF